MKMPSLLRRTPRVNDVAFLFVRGRIDHVLCRRIMRTALALQKREIDRLHLLVSSAGGSMRAATDLYQALKTMPYEIVSWNMGMVGSAANIVYLAGSVRVTVPDGRFLLHPPSKSFQPQERLREDDLERALYVVREQQDIFRDIVTRETGMHAELFERLRDEERLIAPGEAVKIGLAHEIDTPRVTGKTSYLRMLDGDA